MGRREAMTVDAGLRPYPRYRDRHRRVDRRRALVAAALALPVGLALLGLFTLLASAPDEGGKPFEPPAQVSMLSVPGQQWEANRQVGSRPSQRSAQRSVPVPEERKRPAEKRPPERIPGQVVDVAPTADTNPPEDTHRYSEYNTHVAKETQARDKTAFYKNAMPKHTTVAKPEKLAGKSPTDKVEAIGQPNLGRDRQSKKGRQAGQKLELPDVKPRQKLAVAPGKDGDLPERQASEAVQGNSNRLRVAQSQGDGDEDSAQAAGNGGTGSHLDLIPSQSVLDRITGAPANDHLDGVDEGEATYLNTREWKYAGFFNRVKQSVGEHWDPSSALRRRDPSGQIYGWRDRRTVLTIVLNRSGGIQELSVEKSCGVDFLDEEAMAAFRRAQPFSNPPTALVDENGQIKFSFGFYLELSSGGLMRLFHNSPE